MGKNFSPQGLSHLALNSGDMARTVDFYEGTLGFPLIKTMEVPGGNGGQHFFFDIGNGAAIAFFYFPDSPPRPEIPLDPIDGPVPVGMMNHVAMQVAPETFDAHRRKLDELGISYTYCRHDLNGDYSLDPNDPLNEGSFANTVYFTDPDGHVLEFCAWLPGYEEMGNDLEPARAVQPQT